MNLYESINKNLLMDDIKQDLNIEPGSEEEENLNSLYDRKIKFFICPECGEHIKSILDFEKTRFNDLICPKCHSVIPREEIKIVYDESQEIQESPSDGVIRRGYIDPTKKDITTITLFRDGDKYGVGTDVCTIHYHDPSDKKDFIGDDIKYFDKEKEATDYYEKELDRKQKFYLLSQYKG